VKDFDQARYESTEQERAFRIRGVEFTVGPNSMPADWLAEYIDRLGDFETPNRNQGVLAVSDKLILRAIGPQQAEAWKIIRSVDSKNPVNVGEVQEVLEHVIAVTSGRPIESSSGSGGGSGRTTTTSTPPSRSEEDS
jgi:hypothetical protein